MITRSATCHNGSPRPSTDHHDLGIATTHVHFDHETCLEVVILRGRIAAVRSFADALTSQRGVRHVNLHVIPLQAFRVSPQSQSRRHAP